MAHSDHLAVSYGVYVHHGVDVGDGRIAHYGGFLAGTVRAQVEIVDWDTFSQGRAIQVIGSPRSFGPEEIVARALSRVGERRYSLVANNCEHFVHWCRSGASRSRQVTRVLERIGAGAAKVVTRNVARGAAKGTAAVASRTPLRAAAPYLLLADAAQLGTEVAAAGLGAADEDAKHVAQAVGLSASLGIGLLAAGPAGAAIGGGAWAVGEAAAKVCAVRTEAALQAVAQPPLEPASGRES